MANKTGVNTSTIINIKKQYTNLLTNSIYL